MNGKKKAEGVFWGVFFILAAVILLMSNLGYFSFAGISVMGVLATILLAACMIRSIVRFEIPGVVLPAALLVLIYRKPLGLEELSTFTVVVAAILLTIGLSMIFHKKKHYDYVNHRNGQEFQTINESDGDRIVIHSTFSSIIKYINTDNFQQAVVDTSFAALKVYFDNAVIQGDKAIVNIDASFAGVELYVPRNWQVVNKIECTLAGVEEKNQYHVECTKTLILQGEASFSGVTIKYI